MCVATPEDMLELIIYTQESLHTSYSDYDGVQLGLGRTVIVSVTERGWVTVFCRTDGKTLYQEKHHAEYHLVNGLKITYSCILTQVGGMAA